MTRLADLLSTVIDRSYRAVTVPWNEHPIEELLTQLVGNQGEVSGVTLARQILDRYAAMTAEEKFGFFTCLAKDMDIDVATVRSTLDAYEADPNKTTYRAFMQASEPPRQELIRRLNQVPGATATLVDMRADLLKLSRDNADVVTVDQDLRHLFASWFNRGFLVLRPINWESPAHILEKIIAYEAVHTIDSWDDLRRRLHPTDRRCFAYFHLSMANEPLIFVEVALTKGTPNSIQGVLANDRVELAAEEADTAVFYSISNCQPGLAGISFGNSLIKQVVEDLSRELPNLKTFVTLSPIPGLNSWLDAEISMSDDKDHSTEELAAYYLLKAKRDDGFPVDPVARFHLGNGAQVHAIHADADLSKNGIRQSRGTMVNYLYDRAKIVQNHERFANSKAVVASRDVEKLAQIPQPNEKATPDK